MLLVWLLASLSLQPASAQPGFIRPPKPPSPTGAAVGACDKWYPDAQSKVGTAGVSLLRVHLMPDGTIKDSSVIQSSGNAELDKAAVACLAAVRLDPPEREGKPIEVDWERAVIWRAHDHSSIVLPRRVGKGPSCNSRIYHTQGTVKTGITFKIGTEGIPENVTVVESSGNADLDRIGAECIVPSWRFPIASQEGQPVEVDWGDELSWNL
jgi:TonB family protein